MGCSPGREIPHQEPKGTQKGPWRSHLQRPVSLVDDQFTFVQMPGAREWENRRHRSWTPAMVRTSRGKKKAAGNAAHQQGDECVEGAGVPATPPSSISRRCRGHRLRTAKKRGVFPKHPRVRRIAPSPKKQSNDDVRFSDWSSPSRQNDGCGQQPKKKTGFPRRYG